MKQGFLSLGTKDFFKGLIVAVFTAIVSNLYELIQNSITAGTFTWPTGEEIKKAAFYGIAALGAYLMKNLFTNNQDQFMKKDA